MTLMNKLAIAVTCTFLVSCGNGGDNDPATPLVPGQIAVAPVATPIATTPEPVAEPVATTPEPVAEPIVITPEPVAEPVVIAPEPVAEPVVIAPEPVAEPVVIAPEPVVSPTPVPNDGTITGIDPGALSQLYGRATFGYSFTETETVFIADTTFSALNLLDGPDGAILASSAQTAFRNTPEDEFVLTDVLEIRCDAIEESGQFLCVLDPGGQVESLFLFDSISAEGGLGAFEFCQATDLLDCAAEVLQSPDGEVALVFSQTTAIASTDQGEIDSLPYLQYLEQGSDSLSSRSRITDPVGLNAIELAAQQIRSSVK